MNKRSLGQVMLLAGVVLIMVSAALIWSGLGESGITGAVFVIALILTGAGATLSKKRM